MAQISFAAIHIHAMNVFRARYARSSFGQFWFVLTNAVFIASVGFVWSKVWNARLVDYFPYVALGYLLYGHMSQALNEATGAIIADARLYLNAYVPHDFSVLAHLHRTNIQLAYNFLILFPVSVWAGVGLVEIVWFLCNLLLIQLWLYPSVSVIALLCVRYRDLIQLFGTGFQIVFLVTPVMWKIESLPEVYHPYVYMNPFAAALNLTRDVVLRGEVSHYAYGSVCVWILISWLLYFLTKRIYRKEMTLWL